MLIGKLTDLIEVEKLLPLINNGQTDIPDQEQDGEQTSEQNEKAQDQTDLEMPVAQSNEINAANSTNTLVQQEQKDL
jgi:hypothetical protein